MAGEKRQPSSSPCSPCSVKVSVALTTTLHAHQARYITPTTTFFSLPQIHTHTHIVPIPPCKGLSLQVLSLPKPLENLIMRALCGNLSAVYSAELYS